MELLWGIDLGGTKIEGVVLRPGNTPEVLARLRVPTEAQHGYHHIVSQIENLVQQLKTAVGSTPQCLGIGTPGTIDAVTRTLKNSNTTCLIGQPLHKDLERILGTSIVMANDANCFALAEATLGAARGLSEPPEVIFGSIMGTGVGGGIVVNGHIINGRHGIAGEWGHNYLDAEGGDCYCGRQGCVETVISGPALERYYARVTGRQLPLKVIDEAHRAGSDPHASF
ncbi:MAG: ROK family protein [Bacteroidota bacterium]